MFDMRKNYRREDYGDVMLSIIAGEPFYCEPRTFLSSLDSYDKVEIALLGNQDETDEFPYGVWYLPSDLGMDEELNDLFEGRDLKSDTTVASYVAWSDVNRIREFLKDKYGEPEVEEGAD